MCERSGGAYGRVPTQRRVTKGGGADVSVCRTIPSRPVSAGGITNLGADAPKKKVHRGPALRVGEERTESGRPRCPCPLQFKGKGPGVESHPSIRSGQSSVVRCSAQPSRRGSPVLVMPKRHTGDFPGVGELLRPVGPGAASDRVDEGIR